MIQWTTSACPSTAVMWVHRPWILITVTALRGWAVLCVVKIWQWDEAALSRQWWERRGGQWVSVGGTEEEWWLMCWFFNVFFFFEEISVWFIGTEDNAACTFVRTYILLFFQRRTRYCPGEVKEAQLLCSRNPASTQLDTADGGTQVVGLNLLRRRRKNGENTCNIVTFMWKTKTIELMWTSPTTTLSPYILALHLPRS